MLKKLIIISMASMAIIACETAKEKSEVSTSAFDQLSEEQQRKPENALAGMRVPEGLQVQLFASEPLVTNPTNISIDHKGRVWVCEAYNYDIAPEQKDKKGDRIVVLEDADGDGKADKRTVFYQGTDINTPLGVMVLDNKVYISRSPNILVLTDTNGDLQADKKDTLFTNLGNPGDHGAHTLLPGPDGRIYMSIGNYAGNIRYKDGQPVLERSGLEVRQDRGNFMGGMVFRFDPDGSNFEVVGHNFRNNYEPCVDSFGNIFQSDNDDDGYQSCRLNFVMPYGNYGYMDPVSRAAWTTYRMNQAEEIPDRHWHQNDPGVVPNLLITGAGSPAGMAIYEGDLLPAVFQGNPIHAEPYYNEVRSYEVKKNAAGFRASTRSLLKSADQWFRPVDVATAPDGSLFVADWYDPILGGGAAGDAEKGRIYRLAPKVSAYKVPSIGFASPGSSAEALKNPNPETRFLAGQALLSAGPSAEKALLELWNSKSTRFRARALWFLSRLDGKGDQYLRAALRDEGPSIRATAVRAVNQLKEDPVPYLSLVAKDADPAVRREAAISLRFAGTPEAAALWAELATQYDGQDRWYLEALGIGADLFPDLYFEEYLNQIDHGPSERAQDKAYSDIVWRSRSAKALPLLAKRIRQSAEAESMHRYFRAFDYHSGPAKQEVLASLVGLSLPLGTEISSLALQQMDGSKAKITPAMKKALDESLREAKGTFAYLALTEKFGLNEKKHELLQMAREHAGSDLGIAATNLLMRFNERPLLQKSLSQNDETTLALLENLKGQGSSEALNLIQPVVLDTLHSLEIRQAAVRSLGYSWTGEEWLLALVQKEDFPEELKPVAGSILFNVYRSELQREAAKYLTPPKAKDEKLPSIKQLVELRGDSSAGQAIFNRTCSSCHRLGRQGVNFGPELTKIGSKLSKEGLYRAIIYPDEGISYGYEGYLIEQHNEDMVMGIISSETENEIEVSQMGGGKMRIPKADIKKRESRDRSLMPALAPALSQQELVDLVDYLSGRK